MIQLLASESGAVQMALWCCVVVGMCAECVQNTHRMCIEDRLNIGRI
jgi:hypothetical protein